MITGNHISIRPLQPGDETILHRWWNDGSVMTHAGFPFGTMQGFDAIRETVLRDSANQSLYPTSKIFMICKPHDMAPIGEICYSNYDRHDLRCEIGIKICEQTVQDKGYGTEALALFIDYLFCSLNLNKIELTTMPDNERAQHVYAHLGFKRSGVFRKHYFDARTGDYTDCIYMDLLKKEWLKKRSEFISQP